MVADLLAALCLVMVLEGLLAFAVPTACKRAWAHISELPEQTLRLFGAGMIIAGLISLQFVR